MSNENKPDDEFQEIGNCGGKIELLHDEGGISVRISADSHGPMSWVQMGVALDLSAIAYWPMVGVDMRDRPEPSPMVSTFLPSDKTGLFGRECPQCKSYFRTNGMRGQMICPYCTHRAPLAAFTTSTQKKFLSAQIDLWKSAIDKETGTLIDLDEIALDLPSNRPSWTPNEEKQQYLFKCDGCKSYSDILGHFGACPACGMRNSLTVFRGQFSKLDAEFGVAEGQLTDRHEREAKWDSLLPRYISMFEALAKDVLGQLMLFPASPRRRDELSQISFQRIMEARQSLDRCFSFDIFEGVNSEDQSFLHLSFNKRHLLMHSAGKVDAQYLARTKDSSVRLHQKIRIRSKDIFRLSAVLSKCANNLYGGYLSIDAV